MASQPKNTSKGRQGVGGLITIANPEHSNKARKAETYEEKDKLAEIFPKIIQLTKP
ncbi:MAG: hypothetical protein QW819_04590 [Candidatus Korarchaeota archaeon]